MNPWGALPKLIPDLVPMAHKVFHQHLAEKNAVVGITSYSTQRVRIPGIGLPICIF